MTFSIEDLYGCSRQEYLFLADITPEEMIRRLDSEVEQLQKNFKKIQSNSGISKLGLAEMTRYMNLFHEIEKKIDKKMMKIKDIKKEFNLC